MSDDFLPEIPGFRWWCHALLELGTEEMNQVLGRDSKLIICDNRLEDDLQNGILTQSKRNSDEGI